MKTPQNAAGKAVRAEPCQKPATQPKWDMDSVANEGLSIGLAVDWMVQANSVLEDIRLIADIYPEFRAILQNRLIAFNSADWMACEMDQHISRILSRQHTLIKRLSGGAA